MQFNAFIDRLNSRFGAAASALGLCVLAACSSESSKDNDAMVQVNNSMVKLSAAEQMRSVAAGTMVIEGVKKLNCADLNAELAKLQKDAQIVIDGVAQLQKSGKMDATLAASYEQIAVRVKVAPVAGKDCTP